MVFGLDQASFMLHRKFEYINYNYEYSLYNEFDNIYIYNLLMCKTHNLQLYCNYNIFVKSLIKPMIFNC